MALQDPLNDWCLCLGRYGVFVATGLTWMLKRDNKFSKIQTWQSGKLLNVVVNDK